MARDHWRARTKVTGTQTGVHHGSFQVRRNAFRRLLRRFSRSPHPDSDMLIEVTPSVAANQPVGLRVKRPSTLRGLKGPQPRRGHFTPRFAVPRHAARSYHFDGPEEPGSNASTPTGPAA